MSLLDIFSGGKSTEASEDLSKALAAIQGVKTPTADDLKYQLQQYVQAGILTPEQAQTYLQSPNALESENVDQSGTQAQQQAISQLMSAANAGGLNPQEQAQMQQIIQQMNTQEKGANDAVVQNQAARGALTGGETLAAQLQNNQNATVNANQNASNTAGQAYQSMLNELSSAGSLGAGLQGQQNTQANTVAAATNAINNFNATQQQNQENYNVGNRNTAQAENLNNAQTIGNANTQNANAYSAYQAQLPQQVYNDALQKAQSEASVYGQQANQATQQGGQNFEIAGGITGLGATTLFGGNNFGGNFGGGTPSSSGGSGGAGASSAFSSLGSGSGVSGAADSAGVVTAYDGGEVDADGVHNYLQGGQVLADRPQERASMPGNSPRNDTVPARLSPGEIVLPRTVSQHPTEDKVMSFLQRMRKPQQQTHPDDVATVLHALGRVRNG
jgi:hypothetical protein